MKIYIYYWHGQIGKEQEEKLIKMGMYEEDGEKYINVQSIGEFIDKWNEKLILFPPSKKRDDCWFIGLTNKTNFNQC